MPNKDDWEYVTKSDEWKDVNWPNHALANWFVLTQPGVYINGNFSHRGSKSPTQYWSDGSTDSSFAHYVDVLEAGRTE